MGKEARCRGAFEGWEGEGRLQLETDDLVFRGESRLSVPLKTVASVGAEGGWLVVRHPGGVARFELGEAAAERWAHAILNPRGLLDKLGVKPDSRVLIVGFSDEPFARELRHRTPHVVREHAGADGGAAGDDGYDLIIFGVEQPSALAALSDLRGRITQNGGVWVVTPKGRRELGHDPVVAAARAAGLVDAKTARFSDTHTGLKMVIPRADRKRG